MGREKARGIVVQSQLLPHQAEVEHSLAEWVLMCAGLGGGKTHYLAEWGIRRAAQYPSPVLITANTYTQIKDALVPQFRRAFERLSLAYNFKIQDKDFVFWVNGRRCEINLRSVVDFNFLRGPEWGSIGCDEARDYKAGALDVIGGRLRHPGTPADRRQLLIVSTPNGYDQMWELFARSKVWGRQMVQADSFDNPFLSDSYLKGRLRALADRMILQELYAQFVNVTSGRAYSSFDRAVNVSAEQARYNPKAEVVVTHDYNVDPLVAVAMHVERWRDGSAAFRVFREWHMSPGTVPLIVAQIATDLRDHKARIFVNGDPAAKARSWNTGETTWQVVQAHYKASPIGDRVSFRELRQAPLVINRVNSVNAACRNALGETRLWIHPSCIELHADMEQTVWAKNSRDLDKRDPKRTHPSDALGYEVAEWLPLKGKGRQSNSARRLTA